jgi:predicted O-methyltransferase YrrM
MRQLARTTAAIAELPQDCQPDSVVDFLFSAAAESIVPWQIEEEYRALARVVAERRPRTILEIGTADGGTLFAHARLAAEDALIISIDLPEGPFGGGYPHWRIPFYESFARPHQRLKLIRGDSHAAETAERLEKILDGRTVDYAFIDGDHTYDGVRQDFNLCRRLAAADGVIALHDIAEHPNSQYTSTEAAAHHADWAVHDFWCEISPLHDTDEFIADRGQEGYGIGVIYLGRQAQRQA